MGLPVSLVRRLLPQRQYFGGQSRLLHTEPVAGTISGSPLPTPETPRAILIGARDRRQYRQAARTNSARSVRIAPLKPCRGMRPGWRHVLRIPLAVTAKSARGFHALLKCCEAAIRAAAVVAHTVVCAPRIVLGLGACSNADHTDANSQHEQQEPHGSLLGWPSAINPYSCILFPLRRVRPTWRSPTDSAFGI